MPILHLEQLFTIENYPLIQLLTSGLKTWLRIPNGNELRIDIYLCMKHKCSTIHCLGSNFTKLPQDQAFPLHIYKINILLYSKSSHHIMFFFKTNVLKYQIYQLSAVSYYQTGAIHTAVGCCITISTSWPCFGDQFRLQLGHIHR